MPPTLGDPAAGLARAKRLGILRIAARDLLGLDGVEEVGAAAVRAGRRLAAAGLEPGRRHDASAATAESTDRD